MKPKPEERDEGSKLVFDHAMQQGLKIIMMPNGVAFVSHHANYPGITYNNLRHLGNFLTAIIVDGGGTWELHRIAPDTFRRIEDAGT